MILYVRHLSSERQRIWFVDYPTTFILLFTLSWQYPCNAHHKSYFDSKRISQFFSLLVHQLGLHPVILPLDDYSFESAV